MRKLINLSVALLLVVGFTTCEKNDDNNVVQELMLEKSWTQSYEEKTSEEIEIYRPSDYEDFPLSRYRQVFIFFDNNVCDYRVLAANDGHYMVSGSWAFNNQTNIITIYNSESEILFEWEIIELKRTILKMKAKN